MILSLLIFQGITNEELHKLEARHIRLKEGKIYIPAGHQTSSRILKLEAGQIMELYEYIQIYVIRDQKVMLDSDLAELYGVETKRLKEQVKRNIERFPPQYMFELTSQEFAALRSQNATSKAGRGGARYLPLVFTEHGVLQLSNVLKSARAIEVSFKIIDVFVRLREMLAGNTTLRLEIEYIKKKVDNHDKNIELVFQYLDELLEKKENPTPARKAIGYKIKPEEE